MNELASLLPFLAYGFTVAMLGALVHRLTTWDDSVPVTGLLRAAWDLPWPHGVQEEEPVRWNVEALRPRRKAPPSAQRCGDARQRQGGFAGRTSGSSRGRSSGTAPYHATN